MYLRNEEIEAQNRAELAELARVASLAPNRPATFQWELRGMAGIHRKFFLPTPSKIFL